MMRQRAPNLTNLIYHVVRRLTILAGYRPPNTYMMNEAIKQGRAVSRNREIRAVMPDLSEYKDMTSKSEVLIVGSMFCDDLEMDAYESFDLFLDDKVKRSKKCYICTDRHYLAKSKKEFERTATGSKKITRRVNEDLKNEYNAYSAFAYKFRAIEEKALKNLKEGTNWMDWVATKNQIAKVSYSFFLQDNEVILLWFQICV